MMRHLLFSVLLACMSPLWAKPLEQVTVQLHWLHQFEYAGFYIAKEKGYYRDAGLEVVLKELPKGKTEMELLLAGEADYAITGSNVLVDRIDGEPVVALAAFAQYSPISLLVLEESGINSVEDLRGKRIMVSKDNLTIFAMLNQAGLSADEYTVQPQSFNLQDLVEGRTDAFAAFTTNQGFLLQEQGIPYRYIVPADVGIDTYSDVLITTEQEVREHRQRVYNFRQATIKGWEYVYRHTDEAIALILEKYNSQNKSRAALEFEARELRKLVQPLRIELGQMRAEKWEHIRQIYVEQQQVAAESSLEGLLFDERMLPAIALSEREQVWLEQHPVVRIGVDPQWFPFEYLDEDGNYRGVVADVMQRVGELLGVEMRVVEADDWSAMVEQTERGEVDLITAIMQSPERERFLRFTSPYYKLNFTLVTRGEQPQWNALEKLVENGVTVAVPENFITHQRLQRDYPSLSITTRPTVLEVLQAVERGEAEAAVVTMEVAAQLIQAYRLKQVRFGIPLFEDMGALRMAVRKEWAELIPMLNKALETLSEEEIQRIRNKWMAVPVTIGLSLRQVMLLLLVTVLVLGTIIFVIWRSNRMIQRSQNDLVVAKEQAENALQEVRREVQVRKQAELRAQQADRAKSDFLANMSHEIRTPLNAMVGLNGLLIATQLNEEQRGYVEQNIHSSRLLLKIINDVLDVSKIEARGIALEQRPFELSNLLRHLLNILRVNADEKGLQLQLMVDETIPDSLLGDPFRLEQILLNLGSNAIKFSSAGKVQFRVSLLQQLEQQVELEFRVVDTGVGIKPEEQERLFQPFNQANRSIARKYGGTGLGLAIARRLVEQMGGEIGVESMPGEGSTFHFTVTLQFACSGVLQHPRQEPVDRSGLQGMQVLLVEDEATNQIVMGALLRAAGVDARLAENGEEAISAVEEHPVDLVLMDLQMPVMDGFEATAKLRERFSRQQLPIVGTSANILQEGRERIFEVGMNDYLLKPIEADLLYKKLLDYRSDASAESISSVDS